MPEVVDRRREQEQAPRPTPPGDAPRGCEPEHRHQAAPADAAVRIARVERQHEDGDEEARR
jgi:hypothetical protein